MNYYVRRDNDMAKYIRETIYNSDGSIRQRTDTKDSYTLEGGILDESSSPMPKKPVDVILPPDVPDPIDLEVEFATGQGVVVEKETFTVEREGKTDFLGLAKQVLGSIVNTNVKRD
jgi:hypothetical protein